MSTTQTKSTDAVEAVTSVSPAAPVEDDGGVVAVFKEWVSKSPDISIAVAAIHALTETVKRSEATTLMGLEIELKAAADKLKNVNKASIALSAGCELFSRYATRTRLDTPEFEVCKARLIERGELFASASLSSRSTIAALLDRFIRDGQTILVHGYSRVITTALAYSTTRQHKKFNVIVTEGRPNCVGYVAAKQLRDKGVPVTIVTDAAVGYTMEKVDFVLLGAEGVVENGGVINKIGSFQVAMVASAMRKPVYVLAESYKFARLFPLTQADLPERKEDQRKFVPVEGPSFYKFDDSIEVENPVSDYTPPRFISLLFTDLGILTPAAVSDELIKLYYGE